MKSIKLHNEHRILNLVIFLFPIFFLLGNLFINSGIFIVCIIGLYSFRKKIREIFKEKIIIIISLFFLLLMFSTLFDVLKNPENKNFFKSLGYLRYFLILFIFTIFIRSKKLNFKYFFYSALFCSAILSLDIIYQYINNGFDLFGFEAHKYHNSGFLYKEMNAGGYLIKFTPLVLSLMPLFFSKKNDKLFFASLISILVFFTAILLSGNRMPLVMFIIFIFIIIFLIKDLRHSFILGFFLCSITFSLISSLDENYKAYYKSFYDNSISMISRVGKFVKIKYPELSENEGKKTFQSEYWYKRIKRENYEIMILGSGHAAIYITAIDTWLNRPIIGGGIKSFRVKCVETLHLPNRLCQSHPHNYYLEILNDVGILGLILFFYILLNLYKNVNKRYLNKSDRKFLLLSLTAVLILELFPLKSTGSFFSTHNSTYIFILISFILNYKNILISSKKN